MTDLAYRVIDIVAPWVEAPETIVFHHGLGSCGAAWAGWFPALAGRYRLVTFDLRGHGASPVPEGCEWSLDGLVADLAEVADAAGTERFHLVGESIGGTVALAFAAAHPERVRTLTVSNGAHAGGGIAGLEAWAGIIAGGGMAAWSAHMMERRFFPGALDEGRRRWYERMQARADASAVLAAGAMLADADLGPRLGDIGAPVLLLHPDSSPFIPVAVMAELKDRLPDARLRVFPRARHGLPFSHAGECARALAGFLGEAAPGG